MKNLYLSYLILLLILSFTKSEDDFIYEKNILILTDKTFEKAIHQFDYLLSLFYLPYNSQCKKFLTELEKSVNILSKENVTISKIDANIEKNITKKYEINEYPRVIFFIKGGKIEYNGGTKSKGIIKWVMNKIEKKILKLNTAEEIEKLKRENDVLLIYYGNNDKDIQEFTKASKQNEEYPFAIVESEQLINKYSQKGRVTLYKNSENKIVEIINIKEKNINDLINIHAISYFMEFDQKAAQIILGQSNSALIFYSNKKWPSWKEYVKLMKYISIKIKGKLLCIIANIKEKISLKFAEFLGIKEYNLPSLVIVESKGYLKKYKMEKEINETNIFKFIRDWENGAIKEYYKSAKEPKNNENESVIEIVGNNFKEKVFNNDYDVMVLFYTLNCLNCKILLPNYEKLAKKVKEKNNKIIFYKINMGDNEVENEEISSFPCIKLYSWYNKDKNKKSIQYYGDRSIEDIIKFIKNNSGNKIIIDEEQQKIDKKDKISDL